MPLGRFSRIPLVSEEEDDDDDDDDDDFRSHSGIRTRIGGLKFGAVLLRVLRALRTR